MKTGSCAAAATQCLVVPKVRIAQQEVVHSSLTGSSQPKSFQQSICEALAHFGIATNHCRTVLCCLFKSGVKERIGWQYDFYLP